MLWTDQVLQFSVTFFLFTFSHELKSTQWVHPSSGKRKKVAGGEVLHSDKSFNWFGILYKLVANIIQKVVNEKNVHV